MDEWGEEKRAGCEALQFEMAMKKIQRAYPPKMKCCTRCVDNCFYDWGMTYKEAVRKKEQSREI